MWRESPYLYSKPEVGPVKRRSRIGSLIAQNTSYVTLSTTGNDSMGLEKLMNSPFSVFAVSLVGLLLSVGIGALLRRQWNLDDGEREDFGLILAATLTLLGLVIGFSFSMAISRYDARKQYEEEEANAIGTEYVRSELLATTDAAKVRSLLRDYLEERVSFYERHSVPELQQINARTARLQAELWSAVRLPAMAQPTPVNSLAVAGMNDVLNTQGYTQAAWWNRIPVAAWGLMGAIAVCCNVLIGYGARPGKRRGLLLVIMPVVVSISFLLIADIDSPRGGLINVHPQNLVSLSQSMTTP